MDGNQGPPIPPPPFGEPLFMATGQAPGPNGEMLVVLRLEGPGRSFNCLLEANDAIVWGKQLENYGNMSKAGLMVPIKQQGGPNAGS